MLKRLLLCIFMSIFTFMSQAQSIGYIETTKSWYYVYDENGKRVHSFSTSLGELQGYSSSFYILKQGSSFYVLYDANCHRITSLSVSAVGEILSVTGNTFTSRFNSWLYTWSSEGKRISSRSASQ